MRYAPRAILAGGLGFAVSCLAACGGSAGLLSGDQSIALSGQGNEINSAVQSGDCGAAVNASTALNIDVQKLPITVNPTLRANLTQGAVTISQLAAKECRQHTSTTASTGDHDVLDHHTDDDDVDHDAHHVDLDQQHDHDLDDDHHRNHAARHGYYFYDDRWRGARRNDHLRPPATGTGTSGGTGPGDGNSGGNGNGQ